jgi:hypothetical protein
MSPEVIPARLTKSLNPRQNQEARSYRCPRLQGLPKFGTHVDSVQNEKSCTILTLSAVNEPRP